MLPPSTGWVLKMEATCFPTRWYPGVVSQMNVI